MYRMFLGMAALTGLLVLADFATADDKAARAIIDKAIVASGGLETLKKYNAAEVKNTGELDVAGGLKIKQTIRFAYDGRFRDDMEIDANGQKLSVVTVYDGKKAWVNTPMGTQEMTDKLLEEIKEAAFMISVSRLYPLMDKDIELSLLGEEKVDGKPTVGVRVTKKGHRPANLYFDKESGLLVKIQRQAFDPMTEKEIDEVRLIKDYKEVQGLKVPTKGVVLRDGKEYLKAETSEIKMLEKIDDSEFTKP